MLYNTCFAQDERNDINKLYSLIDSVFVSNLSKQDYCEKRDSIRFGLRIFLLEKKVDSVFSLNLSKNFDNSILKEIEETLKGVSFPYYGGKVTDDQSKIIFSFNPKAVNYCKKSCIFRRK